MFTKWLIKIGLVLTPYFVFGSADIRDIKLDIAGVMALAIGLSAIYEYGIKPQRNKWLMLFLWVTCSSYFLAPHSPIQMFGIDVSLFWVWRPMFYFLVFGLMIFSVSSIVFTRKDFEGVLKCMSWCGFVMAVYTILQYLKLDQIFVTCTDATYGRMAGFVGNPTHVSPYMAMIVPIALYLRRKTMAIALIVAVCLTTSTVAIMALFGSLLCYMAMKSKKGLIISILIIVSVCVLVPIGLRSGVLDGELVADHERFTMWSKIVSDLRTPQLNDSKQIFPLTGLGLGTFKYVFHFQHQNSFWQAHNDYFELLYNTGMAGLGLFLAAIVAFLRRNFNIKEEKLGKSFNGARIALLASFICMCITAGGTFIWQIGTTIYYTCLIVGLLSNTYLGGRT